MTAFMDSKGWKSVSLRELIDIKHGFAFKSEFFRDKPYKDVLLTPGNFKIGGGFNSTKKYYDGPVPDEFVLKDGDLLVVMTDLSKQADILGYPALVPASTNERFLHNQRLGLISIRSAVPLDKMFLYYLLLTRPYRNEVLASATGTTVKHTSPERIKAFKFLLPTLPEQRTIAHILGTLDDKIELNRRMSQTLEAMAQALFKSWFVDFEPFRDQGMQDSPLREIPVGWGIGTLSQICEVKMGQSPPGDTYNEMGDGIPFYQGIRDFGFRFPQNRVCCTMPTRFAEPYDVLLSVRAPVGSLNVANETCAIGRGLAALSSKERHHSYLYYLLRNAKTRWDTFNSEGTVFGCITKKDIIDIKIIFPPVAVVERFESVASTTDQLIANNEQETSTLVAVRDTLLPKLLSGEIRVKDAEKFVGETV